MKIVVLGATGMLGSVLCHTLSRSHRVVGIARRPGPHVHHLCDILGPDLWSCLDLVGADVIINASAITNLLTCHRHIDQAYELHVRLPARLAMREEMNILISTDSIFDGHAPPPLGYDEASLPAPLNVYALTKLLGEDPILQRGGLVIRTNIYGFNSVFPGGSLLEWILKSAFDDKPISGYEDVFFNPVSIFQLSRGIGISVERGLTGLLNIGGSATLSKSDFMMTAIRYARPEFDKVTRQAAPEGEIVRPKRTNLDTRLAISLGLPEFDLGEGISEAVALYKANGNLHGLQG